MLVAEGIGTMPSGKRPVIKRRSALRLPRRCPAAADEEVAHTRSARQAEDEAKLAGVRPNSPLGSSNHISLMTRR